MRKRQGVGRGDRGGIELLIIQENADRLQVVAVELQRRAGRSLGIGPQAEARDDARGAGVEADVELDRVDQIVRNPVIREADGLHGGSGFIFGGHGASFELQRPNGAPWRHCAGALRISSSATRKPPFAERPFLYALSRGGIGPVIDAGHSCLNLRPDLTGSVPPRHKKTNRGDLCKRFVKSASIAVVKRRRSRLYREPRGSWAKFSRKTASGWSMAAAISA